MRALAGVVVCVSLALAGVAVAAPAEPGPERQGGADGERQGGADGERQVGADHVASMLDARALFVKGCAGGDLLSCVHASWALLPAPAGDALHWSFAAERDACFVGRGELAACRRALSMVGAVDAAPGSEPGPLLKRLCEGGEEESCEAVRALEPLEVRVSKAGIEAAGVTVPWCRTADGAYLKCLWEVLDVEASRRSAALKVARVPSGGWELSASITVEPGLDFAALVEIIYTLGQARFGRFLVSTDGVDPVEYHLPSMPAPAASEPGTWRRSVDRRGAPE